MQLDTLLRIGFVGLATQAKGIDFFIDVARDFKSRYPKRVEFCLVGSAFPGEDLARVAVLEDKATDTRLPRADFIDLLAPLHFALLPYRRGYYERSASGALIDAITWLKPIIARRLPIVEQLFGGFGDVGYLCDDDSDMRQALETVLARMDRDCYNKQIAALRMARASRTPEALADDYRATLTAGFRQSGAEL